MIVTIHQPEHLPWLGLFDKIRQADTFVILDNVQFEKNYFQNRNKIRTQQGWIWLTVPVLAKGKSNQLIKDVQINNAVDWQTSNWKSIFYAYNRAACYKKYCDSLELIYNKTRTNLADFNEEIIRYILTQLGIRAKIVRASALNVTGRATDLLLEICRKLSADIYLSGISGKNYLDEEQFKREGIKVVYQEFYHPIYRQVYEPFIPGMSVVDLLFNHGDKSLDIIKGIGVERMTTLFE